MILKEIIEQANKQLAENFNGGDVKNRSLTAIQLINNHFTKPKEKGLSLRNEQRQDFVLDTTWLSSRETSRGVHFKISRKEYSIENQRYSWRKNYIDFKISVDEEYVFSKECLEKTIEEITAEVKERETRKAQAQKEFRQKYISEFQSELEKLNLTFEQFYKLNNRFDRLEYEEKCEFEKKVDKYNCF